MLFSAIKLFRLSDSSSYYIDVDKKLNIILSNKPKYFDGHYFKLIEQDIDNYAIKNNYLTFIQLEDFKK